MAGKRALHLLAPAALLWACGSSPAFAYYVDGSTAVFGGISLFLLTVGLLLFFSGFKQVRKKRLIEDIPTSTIRSMAPGQVEIIGEILDWHCLTGPVTRQPCVYYELEVEQYVKREKNSGWESVFSEKTRNAVFCIKDGTGAVPVATQGAEMILSRSYGYTPQRFEDIPESLERYLSGNGYSCRGFLGSEKELRFTERNFGVGETLYVMGVCQAGAGKGLESPEGAAEGVLVGRGSKPGEVFILSGKSQKGLASSYGWGAFFSVTFPPKTDPKIC